MVRARFTEEQIADFLQQSKNGVPNKALCEEYGFSNSTLRRWQEKHAESIRQELKQIESTAKIVFLCFIVAAILLTLMFPKPTGALAIPPYLVYCISYIRRPQRRGIVNPVAHKTDHMPLAFEQSDDALFMHRCQTRKQRRTGGQRRQRVVA